MKSQIETTNKLQEIADSVTGSRADLLVNLQKKVFELITVRPYNEQTMDEEHTIRWKRTADQIFKDGYVYDGKACTDLVIAFLGLAKAKGLEARFVKITKEKMVHSVAEVKVKGQWYVYNVSKKDAKPTKGIASDVSSDGWKLWKRGRDSWDVGLGSYEDMGKFEKNRRVKNSD